MNKYLERISRIEPAKSAVHKLVSFFSGGGGLDLGLEYAGFRTVFATDVEASYCGTIEFNLKTKAEAHDINELTGKYITKLIGSTDINLVAGGPPCQSFSILGSRGSVNDPRGKLVFEYARIITELKPKAFVFENVPGLLTVNKGQDWKNILDFFEKETRYKLFFKVLNSADFGVPQIRKRVFLVGFRRHNVEFEFPEPIFSRPDEKNGDNKLPQWLPAKLALSNVAGLPNHDIRIHSDRVRNRYEKIEPGGRDKTDHTDRIHPDRPSGTVLVGSAAGGGRPFIHPSVPRHISVREAARLQSFPDWYEIRGTGTQQFRQVGNAVPPLLAYAIGRQIRKALEKGAR